MLNISLQMNLIINNFTYLFHIFHVHKFLNMTYGNQFIVSYSEIYLTISIDQAGCLCLWDDSSSTCILQNSDEEVGQ